MKRFKLPGIVFAVALLAAFVGPFAFGGCADKPRQMTPAEAAAAYVQEKKDEEAAQRFSVQEYKTDSFAPSVYIITDKENGCQYLSTKNGYSGGLQLIPNTCNTK